MRLHPAAPFMFGILNAGRWFIQLIRKLGILNVGTSENPLYFNAGDSVPPWVILSTPMCKVTFDVDVETFWMDGVQHVFPMWKVCAQVITVTTAGPGIYNWHAGAPAQLWTIPRPKRPRKVENHVSIDERNLVPA